MWQAADAIENRWNLLRQAWQASFECGPMQAGTLTDRLALSFTTGGADASWNGSRDVVSSCSDVFICDFGVEIIKSLI